MAETIYEAAGGRQAFMNLARAWHARCLADPVVSHAFSHGYHPQHTERLVAYWAEALGGPTDYTESMGMNPASFECTQGTASTWRWTSEHRSASLRRSTMPEFPATLDYDPR
jgi:truncated hemoglobin YjbI